MRRREFLGWSAKAAVSGAILAGAAAPFALAQADANLGPLQDLVLSGANGDWTGGFEQGFYVLRNERAAGAAVYFTAVPAKPPEWLSIDAHCAAAPEAAYSAAGLLLNLTADGQSYFAIALQPDGQIAVYRRDPKGLARVALLPGQDLRPDVVTRLSAHQTAEGVEFQTNGKRAGLIKGLTLAGRHGIVALDRGSFYFANFLMT